MVDAGPAGGGAKMLEGKELGAWKKLQSNLTLIQAGELDKRLLQVDTWANKQNELLAKTGIGGKIREDQLTAITAAGSICLLSKPSLMWTSNRSLPTET